MSNPHDEKDLEAKLLSMYKAGGSLNPPYWARYFYQLFTPGCQRYIGGIKAVCRVMCAGGDSYGMQVVKQHGRLDLAVETVVLDPEWTHLFENSDRAMARHNLRRRKKRIR